MKILYKRTKKEKAPSISLIRGECSALALGRVGQVGRVRPVRSVQEPILIRAPFAFFVSFRGLKTSIGFPLFSSHKRLKIEHERERANKLAFLLADTIRLSADFLIASADRIRKPADTIRKKTKRVKKLFTKNTRKERGFLIKSAPLAGFCTTFPFQGSKKGSQNSADGAEGSFSQGFREIAPVKFSERFRNYRISPTSLTLRKGYCRFCLSDSMRAKSLSTASSSAIFFSTHTLPR